MLLVTLAWVAFYAYNKVFDWINTYKPKDVAGTYRLVRTTLPIPANTYTKLTIKLYENEVYATSPLPDTLNIGRSGHYQLWSKADQTHPITFVNKEETSDGYFEKPGRISFKTREDLDNPVTIAVFERSSQR